jgi:hypothetical protein
MGFVLFGAYMFAIGACFASVVITFTGDWRRVRDAKKQRELDARVNLGRLAMNAEHGRVLLAASTAIDLSGAWR